MKKFIPILLAFCMLMTTSCFASDEVMTWSNVGNIDLNKKTSTADGVNFTDDNVNITIGGDYTLEGTLEDGMIYINTNEKVMLRLNGVNITNQSGPAIYFDNTEKGYIELKENTFNYITDGASYESEDADAVLFSNDEIEILGSGNITVKANYKHGIVSEGNISIKNGVINIESIEHGIKSDEKVYITGGKIDITSTADGKGIKAEKEFVMDDGDVNITMCDEGIESKGILTINGGNINIVSLDDAINTGSSSTTTEETAEPAEETPKMDENMRPKRDDMTPPDDMPERFGNMPQRPQMAEGEMPPEMPNENRGERPDGKFPGGMGPGFEEVDEEEAKAHTITINGGNINITADGDGIDSNGNLIINGGYIVVNGPEGNDNGALDSTGKFELNGGTVLTMSSAGMMTFPRGEETQNIINVTLDEMKDAGTIVSVKDSNGNELISEGAKKKYQRIMFSSNEIKEDEEYTVYIDGEKVSSVIASKNMMNGGFDSRRPFGEMKDEKRVRVKLNGSDLKFGQMPVIKNGTTLVPLRSIFEALGITVEWDDETQTVTATKDDKVITLQIGNKTANLNGKDINLLTEPEIIGESTMVPVRFISESVGLNVSWDEVNWQVDISA